MAYIPDIDELIVGPPYRLGTNDTNFRFRAHDFILNARPGALTTLVDNHLNRVFDPIVAPGPRRSARLRDGTIVNRLEYRVPDSRPVISFLNYKRVDATNYQNEGWLAYSEALVWFYIKRWRDDTPDLCEALILIGHVYIDEDKFLDPESDPFSVPIVFGRELFGMPKAPGQIVYEPDESDFKQPRLEIWDYDDPDARLRLKPAIVFGPDMLTGARMLTTRVKRLFRRRPRRPRTELVRRNDLEFTARCLKLPRGVDSFRKPTDLEEEIFQHWCRTTNARDLSEDIQFVVANVDGCETVFQTDLELNSKLVGLKQFVDPSFVPNPANPLPACYQAIVETPVEQDPRTPPSGGYCSDGAVIEFPDRDRVDIITSFGLTTMASPPNPPRRVDVPDVDTWYRTGRLVFANPLRTSVYDII